MNTNFKIGDTVYFIEHWTDTCHKAIISNIKVVKVKDENKLFAELEDLTVPGSTGASFDNLYKTEDECMNAIRNKEAEIRKEYTEQIKSVEDLIRFMYDYNVATCEEYTDWTARTVAKNKAKELLGIDL